jgi:Ser/Thr protein kinase RdoA (MazF antagonist)
VFQHGNFRLDNVLVGNGCLGLIDFENCGSGSCYQDLSRPITDLVLMSAAFPFFRRRLARCAAAFLAAYGGVRSIDNVRLWELVVVRLARYYLEARAQGFRTTVGGMPVSKRRLDRLLLAAVEDRTDAPHLDISVPVT